MKREKLILTFLLMAALILGSLFIPGDRADATALSADRPTQYYEGARFFYPVAASTTIYQGGLVCMNTSGYAVPCADTANYIVMGVSVTKADNSSGANGAINVEVRAGTIEKYNATSITQAMVGSPMYVKDDNTFDDTSTNLVFAGWLEDYDSSSVGWIRLPEGEISASGVHILDAATYFESTNVEGALAETWEILSGSTTGWGAALIGIEDAATYYESTDVEAALAEIWTILAGNTTGWGAALVDIADAGSLVTATSVEAAIQEAFQHIQTAQAFIPIGLTTLRETDASNVPNLAAHGGQLASDSTPILDYTNGDTDSALRLAWAASNSDPVAFQTPLPPDLNTGATVAIHFRAAMAGTTDSPVMASDCYFNEGDTKVEDGVTVTGTSYAEYVISIAAADVPAGAQTMTCELTTGTHTTDIQYITAIWIEYKRSTLTQ